MTDGDAAIPGVQTSPRMMWAARASWCLAIAIAGAAPACRRPPPPPAPAAPTQSPSHDPCYPYARRDGRCVKDCDPAIGVPYPQSHPDCAQGGWPLLCNDGRECYPVEPSVYDPSS